MPYLNVDEVKSALEVAANPPNDGFTELIRLRHATWQGRECHAIKLGRKNSQERIGVYLIGGVHAREWGTSDILINFVEKLSQAYRTHTGLTLGGKTFSDVKIQDIVNGLDIFVFPQVNPDGRNYSMTERPSWRKNLRPAPDSHPDCPGVDINRSYSFLRRFTEYFAERAPVNSSEDPCEQNYIGPRFSGEPETANVVSIVEDYRDIRYFVDVHTYSELILYPWADDHSQTTDPEMSFRNRQYDDVRGLVEGSGADAYREYISTNDLNHHRGLAIEMCKAIEAVRGRLYRAQPAVELYVTSGTSRDYMFSRIFQIPGRKKIYSFTIECGSEENPTPFHPPYDEYMQPIIQEVTAGLLEFCLRITPRISFSSRRINFGRVSVGARRTRDLRIKNIGPRDLDVSFGSSSTPPFLWERFDAPISSGGERLIRVTFAPEAEGFAVGALRIQSNAAGSPHSIELIGGPEWFEPVQSMLM